MRSASLAHYRVVSTHVPQSKSVAENHHIIAPGSEVVVGNGAARFGGYAKQREEVGGNLITLDRSAKSLPVRLTLHARSAESTSNPLACSLKSRKLAGATGM